MRRGSLYVSSIICVLLFLAACCIIFSTSLWFLYALAGRDSQEYAVGYINSFINSNSAIKSIEQKFVQQLPIGVSNFNRFVYTRDGQGESVAGIPKVLHQFSLQQELKDQSYSVRRFGWVLVATKNVDSKSATEKQEGNIVRTFAKTFAHVFVDGLPAHTQLILQSKKGDSNTYSLYIEENKGAIHAVIHDNSGEFVRGSQKPLQGDIENVGTTLLVLPQGVMPKKPNGFLTVLENKVSELMAFTKTRPRILESVLAENKAVLLSIKGNTVAIGVQEKNDTTASLIHAWMQAEQGTRHPQKKAFALPDKTIGYEYIPGQSNASFSLAKGSTTCLPSEDYDEQLFLCGKDEVLVLSNSEQAGNSLVTLLSASPAFHQGSIQGNALQAIGLGDDFEKIEYSVKGDMTEVWADLKTR